MKDEPVMTPEEAETAERSAIPPVLDTYLMRATVRHPSKNVKAPTLDRVKAAVALVLEDLCEGDGLEGVVVNVTAEHV